MKMMLQQEYVNGCRVQARGPSRICWSGITHGDGCLSACLSLHDRCGGRLGSFNWSGMQSATGRWVVPAFQLHMSRVDTQTPLPLALAALVRQPKTGAPTSVAKVSSMSAWQHGDLPGRISCINVVHHN